MAAIILLSALITTASAHGYVQGIVAAGTYYSGYSPSFQYQNPSPTVPGWSDPEDISNGYIAPSAYTDPDIICHLSATPGGTAAKVSAGDTVELQWTVWPDSHHGPVLDYIAKCPGESCEDVEKGNLEFVKIGEGGLVGWEAMPGKWASDELISNNNSWSITIPKSLAPGSYVLRHEIIALHSANSENGAQNYPQCINLDITSSEGSEDLSSAGAIPATEFYKSDDPGLLINIYTTLTTYSIPGPTLWSGAATKNAAKQTVESYATTTEAGKSTSHATPTAASSPASKKALGASPSLSSTSSLSQPSPYSKIAALIDALPSDALTEKIVLPSATATADTAKTTAGTVEWVERPEKDLPEGWNLRDLLGWVQFLMREAWEKGDGERMEKRALRGHGRDFSRNRR